MYGESDDAADMAAADQSDEALDRVLARARELAESLTRDWARHELAREVHVALQPGSQDDVLVFTVALQLSEDFDTEKWPGDAVSRLRGGPAGTGSQRGTRRRQLVPEVHHEGVS